MAANNRSVIDQQNLDQMIRNMYYSRDGKNGYATYYSFNMEVTFPEFSNRNTNVLVDCSDEVLQQRVLAIDENELSPSSEIVKLEEDVVGEAIVSVGRKRELLENLEEELIAYKARCNRLRVRIDDRIIIVEAARAVEQARSRQQAEPLDLSRNNRQEALPGQQFGQPVVRLRRFDQDRPEIVIPRCDAPRRQPQPDPQPPVIQPIEVAMAEQQQVDMELQQNADPEIDIIENEEVIMEVEDSIHSTESTDTENGKGVNLINLVTLVDPQIVKEPKRKRKRKNILGKSNGFAKRFVNKAKVIPNVRESTLSKIAQSKKAVSRSKSKQDEIYTQIFENKEQKSTLSKFKIGKKGDSGKNEINNGIETQSVNRSGALKVIKTIDVNSIKPGHCKITFENKLREKFRKRFQESIGNFKFVNSTDDEIDEVENAIYDQAIHQMENAGNVGVNVHDWAEEVLANEIAQNAQIPQPEIIVHQPAVQQNVQMNPLPQPMAWNNTRFGAEALEVVREYGRDIIIRLRLHEDRDEKAMVHLSTDVRENVFGERAVMQWAGVYTHPVGARTNPIPNIHCRLDGAPFVYAGLRRQYALRLFPYTGTEDDAIIATGWLVPPIGHTPDFSLERVVLGEDFLAENLHSINPGLMEVTLRADNGHLIRKRYQLRNRMRN
ncbi:hypothetical protein V9T40_013891 [Parthenolecanium corni]|uniref:Uncharacterized protein n=1 Tax=Parthenolecanium corni TaxID=536013 RepID=A0AAN9Y324_9HEMI